MKFYCLVSDELVGHAHPSLEANLRSQAERQLVT